MCKHRRKVIRTEADGCHWVQCAKCPARGPKRHSIVLAKKEAKGNLRLR